MPGPPPTAYLKGGPCDGTTRKLTGAELRSGTLTCKGSTYNHTNTLHGTDVVFLYAAPPSSGTTDPSVKAPHAQKGWQDMQHSLSKNLPAALSSSRRLHSATLRTLSRARKVKH